MTKKISKFVYWTPRILGLLFVAFLGLFSFDVISPELGFWQILGGLFMHNIPALILLAVVLVSWKHELVGAIVFTLAGLLYIIITALNVSVALALSWSFIIAGPAFLVGILFFINWLKKGK